RRHHVSWPHRRIGTARRIVRASQSSVRQRPAGIGAYAGSEKDFLPAGGRRDAVAAASAVGLPLSSTLSACDAALPRRAATAEGSRAAAFLGLPSERWLRQAAEHHFH